VTTPLAYWIQRADFTATDHEAADAEEAIHVLANHDWQAELRLEADLTTTGQESCPPGIGFMAPDGPILHVCPTIDGGSLVHFHPTRPKTLLDRIRASKAAVYTKQGVGQAEVVELIRWFFAGRHDSILRNFAAA